MRKLKLRKEVDKAERLKKMFSRREVEMRREDTLVSKSPSGNGGYHQQPNGKVVYICDWGIINCPQCMVSADYNKLSEAEKQVAQARNSLASQTGWRQLKEDWKRGGGMKNSWQKPGGMPEEDKVKPRMRPCGSTGPCKCFPDEDYEFSGAHECKVLKQVGKLEIKKTIGV